MVQPHVSSMDKDKQKIITTTPIALLPTATLQSAIPSQFLTSQQLQVLQSKTSQNSQSKATKQSVFLPNQAKTSQTFTTQHIPQHQLLLLMQQQQQQQQRQHQVNQGQLSTMQNKSGSTGVHSQNFVSSAAMQIGYPSSFLTLSDGHIDVSKAAAFASLPTFVQLEKPKVRPFLDSRKIGTIPSVCPIHSYLNGLWPQFGLGLVHEVKAT